MMMALDGMRRGRVQGRSTVGHVFLGQQIRLVRAGPLRVVGAHPPHLYIKYRLFAPCGSLGKHLVNRESCAGVSIRADSSVKDEQNVLNAHFPRRLDGGFLVTLLAFNNVSCSSCRVDGF